MYDQTMETVSPRVHNIYILLVLNRKVILVNKTNVWIADARLERFYCTIPAIQYTITLFTCLWNQDNPNLLLYTLSSDFVGVSLIIDCNI